MLGLELGSDFIPDLSVIFLCDTCLFVETDDESMRLMRFVGSVPILSPSLLHFIQFIVLAICMPLIIGRTNRIFLWPSEILSSIRGYLMFLLTYTMIMMST